MTTRPCPHCSSPVLAESRFCGQCGKTIDLEVTRRVPITLDDIPAREVGSEEVTRVNATAVGHPGDFAKTITEKDTSSVEAMLASLEWTPPPSEPKLPAAPTPPAPEPEPEPARAPTFNKTMIGGSITAADVMAEHERTKVERQAPAAQNSRATIVGAPAFDAVPPEPPPAPAADPQAYRPAFKTMLGVAIPGIAPVRDSERALLAAANPAPPPAPSSASTLHGGVGTPGSNPQFPVPAQPRPQTAPLARPQPLPAPPPIVPPPAPLVEEPLPQAPRIQPKRGISALTVVAIVFGLVLAGGAVAAVVLLRGGAPLTAKARLDESGKESLEIHCASCPDGTAITLGASNAAVTAETALLALPAPLSIGDNDLEIAIDRPGAGRDEKVKVHVPIAYRVKADLTTLGVVPPSVTVRVEATPGAEVTVDGKPLALDASGKGAYALDVSAEALGASNEQKTIDRKIPFTVKRKGAATAEPGELVVRAAVVPLHLDAPGAELVTDRTTANVAGQTKPGGTLTVDGQNVPVDAAGRFAIRAELPSEGDKTLTIVAASPPLAPRTIRAKISRVASVESVAQKLDAANPAGFDAYGADPASKIGQAVVIHGEILEIRTAQGYSAMVVEEKKTCAAGGCVVRLTHGEEVRAARGDSIRAYGTVAGTVASNGKQVPSIVGTLVLPMAKGTNR